MSDLIDRYVRDATRSLAPEARTARSAELRGRIEGRIAERASAGEPDAERATLIELGDPEILDAQAAGRPLHLIGPRYFLQWKRLLILLLSIAPAAVAFAVTLAYSIDGRSFAEILGGAIGTAVSVAVHLVVWVTVVFAVIVPNPIDEQTHCAASA